MTFDVDLFALQDTPSILIHLFPLKRCPGQHRGLGINLITDNHVFATYRARFPNSAAYSSAILDICRRFSSVRRFSPETWPLA